MHGLNFILLVATLGVVHAENEIPNQSDQSYYAVPVQYSSFPEAVVPTIKAVGPANYFQYSAYPSQTFVTDPQYIRYAIPVETREPEPVVKYVSTMKQTIREPTFKFVSVVNPSVPEPTFKFVSLVKPVEPTYKYVSAVKSTFPEPTVKYDSPVPESQPQIVQYTAPQIVAAPNVYHKFHTQTADGAYSFGYSGGPSSRHEIRDKFGIVHGAFNYVDGEGKIQSQQYVADAHGFRTAATNLPVAPSDTPEVKAAKVSHDMYRNAKLVPVEDTPEVKAAKAAFEEYKANFKLSMPIVTK